ncbi:hypothetical protein [Photobacterium halotolerans]|uniref:hypothetical protein n=1 Tax=Photobacterium halotolerans TaxID=265726 RepID=UPI0004236E34|nr:hypothetical protein [Photobacterium halotolerans]
MSSLRKDVLFTNVLVAILFLTFFRDVLQLNNINGISFLLAGVVFFTCCLCSKVQCGYKLSELLPFFLLMLISLLSILFNGVDGSYHRYILGYYYSFLFFIVYVFCRLPSLTFHTFIGLCKWYFFVLFLIVLIACVQAVFYISPPSDYPLAFLRDTPSVFPHPVYLFATITLAFSLSLALYSYYKNGFYFFTSTFLFLCQLFTFSRKSLSALILLIAFFYLWELKRSGNLWGKLIVLFISIVIAVFFLEPFLYRFTFFLEETSGIDMSARSLMFLSSIDIATENFPLGSGPGTFGSAPAAIYYSPLYFQYGLNSVFGLEPTSLVEGNVSYLMDTFWPHVIAEYGFIGTGVYFFMLLNPLRIMWNLKNSENREVMFFSRVVIFVNIAVVFESLGGSYPSQLYFILIYSVLSALSVTLLDKFQRHS